MTKYVRGLGVIGLGLLLIGGCGGEDRPVPVTLTVNYNGKPLSDVRVNLLGPTGSSAFAVTDASGKAANFNSTAPGAGVPPGTYTLTLAPNVQASTEDAVGVDIYNIPAPKLTFPAKYRSMDTSGETIEVKPGDANDFQVELKD